MNRVHTMAFRLFVASLLFCFCFAMQNSGANAVAISISGVSEAGGNKTDRQESRRESVCS